MLKIDDRNTEEQIKEILQNTNYSSAQEYLKARIDSDFKAIKKRKRLSI